ncbi:traK family protein [Escherichia coli]|uniref:traK family protein n=1 Tax=Escherichia coli TaxID=562 RepID=UPI00164FFA82|nr:traK family protein [Escherichia coli]
MRKNNTAIIFGSLFFSCSVMAANGTLAPTVVPMVNGGQASIAISNTSPNLFTVPGDRIDELQKIQFDRLDFTNFYEDLMNNQKIPDSGVLTQKVKEQIADQLKQAGQ